MDVDKILDLFKKCDFTHTNCDTVDEDVLNYLPKEFDYDWRTGASKLVLIPCEENYVIKLPFKGNYHYFYDENEQFKTFSIPGLPALHEFDHCAEELKLYHIASKYHTSQILLKNIYIGEVNEEPVYIQQKAVTFNEYYDSGDEDYFDNESVHTQEEIESMEKSYEKSNVYFVGDNSKLDTWLTDVHKYYGEKQFIKFLQFIDSYINDLHSENIGYIGDRPVIIDYASFYG